MRKLQTSPCCGARLVLRSGLTCCEKCERHLQGVPLWDERKEISGKIGATRGSDDARTWRQDERRHNQRPPLNFDEPG